MNLDKKLLEAIQDFRRQYYVGMEPAFTYCKALRDRESHLDLVVNDVRAYTPGANHESVIRAMASIELAAQAVMDNEDESTDYNLDLLNIAGEQFENEIAFFFGATRVALSYNVKAEELGLLDADPKMPARECPEYRSLVELASKIINDVEGADGAAFPIHPLLDEQLALASARARIYNDLFRQRSTENGANEDEIDAFFAKHYTLMFARPPSMQYCAAVYPGTVIKRHEKELKRVTIDPPSMIDRIINEQTTGRQEYRRQMAMATADVYGATSYEGLERMARAQLEERLARYNDLTSKAPEVVLAAERQLIAKARVLLRAVVGERAFLKNSYFA
jgi:hypothetical protein